MPTHTQLHHLMIRNYIGIEVFRKHGIFFSLCWMFENDDSLITTIKRLTTSKEYTFLYHFNDAMSKFQNTCTNTSISTQNVILYRRRVSAPINIRVSSRSFTSPLSSPPASINFSNSQPRRKYETALLHLPFNVIHHRGGMAVSHHTLSRLRLYPQNL